MSEQRTTGPRRIVVTGGPGAGKTAVLEIVRRTMGTAVAVLPEAAGIIFGGGFPRRPSPACRRAAQRAIFRVQVELERLAEEEESAPVVLCDRGTVDGLAYWPESPESFWEGVGSSLQAELARYHAVIHLCTPSARAGYNHANPLRIETAREAARIDERILQAWSAHPRRFVIESDPDFLRKATTAMALIDAELRQLGWEPAAEAEPGAPAVPSRDPTRDWDRS